MASESFPSGGRGTRAHQPDLDWSQVRETVLILELAASQVEAAMRDSDKSVEVLANSFTSVADNVRTITELIQALPVTPELAERKATLGGVVEQISTMVNQAVMSFQFYDKLAQRLAHVVHGLGDVNLLVGDKARLYNPQEWVALQEGIKAQFSTDEERALFNAVLIEGLPIEEALNTYLATLKTPSGDVELF